MNPVQLHIAVVHNLIPETADPLLTRNLLQVPPVLLHQPERQLQQHQVIALEHLLNFIISKLVFEVELRNQIIRIRSICI